MKLTMTAIKDQSKFIRGLSILALACAFLSLSACGGAKKVSTKDNSTEYKSARALAPLKKPSRVVSTARKNPVVGTASTQVSTQERSVSVPLETADSRGEIRQNLVIESNIVTVKSGQARLQIMADFDQAWEQLNANLQASDLTVFSRNKAAGRFSIGCLNLEAAPEVIKKGRWSFFNRDKQEEREYCALQVISKRGLSTVSVLNRAGEEVSAEYSNSVLKRLTNN
jgi:uncharacterized lipoprotein